MYIQNLPMCNFLLEFQASYSSREYFLWKGETFAGELPGRSQLVQGVLVRDALQHFRREEFHCHRRSKLGAGESWTQECAWSHSGKVKLVFAKMFRQSPIFFKFSLKPSLSYNTNMATFVTLRHLVNILVTDFTNPSNLTNDLLIFNSLILFKPLVSRWWDETGNLSCLY